MSASDPRDELARVRRRVAELETLARVEDLLDPDLEGPQLLDLALVLALQIVRADAALLAHDRWRATIMERLRPAGVPVDLPDPLPRFGPPGGM